MALGKYILASIGIGGAYVALPTGQPDTAQTFALTAQAATERLEAKHEVVNGTGLGSLTIRSAGTERGALVISVKRAGDPRGVECRVTISPATPDTSRAQTDCTQPNSKDQPMRHLGSNALALVVREHVAATLEGRRYDTDRVANGMIALVVTNAPVIAASVSPQRD